MNYKHKKKTYAYINRNVCIEESEAKIYLDQAEKGGNFVVAATPVTR